IAWPDACYHGNTLALAHCGLRSGLRPCVTGASAPVWIASHGHRCCHPHDYSLSRTQRLTRVCAVQDQRHELRAFNEQTSAFETEVHLVAVQERLSWWLLRTYAVRAERVEHIDKYHVRELVLQPIDNAVVRGHFLFHLVPTALRCAACCRQAHCAQEARGCRIECRYFPQVDHAREGQQLSNQSSHAVLEHCFLRFLGICAVAHDPHIGSGQQRCATADNHDDFGLHPPRIVDEHPPYRLAGLRVQGRPGETYVEHGWTATASEQHGRVLGGKKGN